VHGTQEQFGTSGGLFFRQFKQCRTQLEMFNGFENEKDLYSEGVQYIVKEKPKSYQASLGGPYETSARHLLLFIMKRSGGVAPWKTFRMYQNKL
jgi:hypothetical protein